MKRLPTRSLGIKQLIPFLIVGLIFFGFFAVSLNKQPPSSPEEKVLSKGSDDGDSGSSGSSGSGSSGSSGTGGGSSATSVTSGTAPPAVTDTPDLEDGDVGDEEEGAKPAFTKIRVEEGKTRLERVFFEGGVKKKVELRNENGRVRVRVKTETAEGVETSQTLDLRPEDGRITLKVEDGGVEQKVTVKSLADRFVIEQKGFEVPTNFPLTIDTQTNTLTVITPVGVVNVRELPAEAIEAALNSRVLSQVTNAELVQNEDAEDPNEQVVYRLAGVRKVKFLGVFSVNAPILAEVSAATGEQTFVSEPWYLSAFGFLFSQ